MFKLDLNAEHFTKPSGDVLEEIIITDVVTSSRPDWTAATETSIRKKYEGGIGGRTIYSVGATNSTLPLESSGL